MPVEVVAAIEAFLSSTGGGGTLLVLGLTLEFLFAMSLFRWKPLAFVNAWIALVLAMLLAISSEQRTVALMLTILAVLSLLDIPLVAVVRAKLKRRMQELEQT